MVKRRRIIRRKDPIIEEDTEEVEEQTTPERKASERLMDQNIADVDDVIQPDNSTATSDDVVSIKMVNDVITDNVFSKLLESLDKDESVIITSLGNGKWKLSKGDTLKMGLKKMTKAEAMQEMYNPAYIEFYEWWKTLDYEAKVKEANAVGAEWESHENERVDIIKLTQAYRDVKGVEKYKPEYRTRSARAALLNNI